MRNLDAGLLTALRAGQAILVGLASLDIGGTEYLYTDADVPVAQGGDLYRPREWAVADVRLSSKQIVDTTSLTVANLDDELLAPFVGGDPQGSAVRVGVAAVDLSTLAVVGDARAELFRGTIDDWKLAFGQVQMTLATVLTRWRRDAGRVHGGSCQWRVFKGGDCRYAGAETWCDRSFSRCQQLGNVYNYGGFRWLPSIEQANVRWGAA